MTNVEKINKVIPYNHIYISTTQADKILSSEYQQDAVNFLIETKTTCEIVFKGLATPNWGRQEVNSYKVTLKNKKHTYSFDWYDSIKNTQDNKKATYDFYSILAGLNTDFSLDFDEFCSSYGYEFSTEKEFIKVKSVYFAVIEETQNLKKLFNEQELEKLSEIN